MGWNHPSVPFCMSTAPEAYLDASVLIMKGWVVLGMDSTGSDANCSLSLLKASCWLHPQVKPL